MQSILQKPLNSTWLKAAVVGSLWASVEIIIGSFLHNLRIPFSGTLLTAFSVFLLIAFLQLWDDPGILWRAGLICALMKSLSPSAVILGPMAGIFTEALILWIFILVFGRNLFSYILAGALAVASALVHKAATLLVLYGFDLVRVLEGLYQYTVKQLRIENADPAQLIWAIVLIYILLGGVAAVLGYVSGRHTRVKTLTRVNPFEGSLKSRNELFQLNSKRRYSLALLFLHLLVVILCLWLLNIENYIASLVLCSTYLTGCIIWYKNALGHLKKPGLWLQFLVITLIASFLLEGYSSGNYFSFEGLIIGLKMNLRAVIIMVGFSAISVELKNPLVRSILHDRGMDSLHQSLSLAFSALPGIISNMPSVKEIFRERKSFISFLFANSRELLKRLSEDQLKKPALVIISGEVGSGKTTFVTEVINTLKEEGIIIAGFTAPGVFKDHKKQGFWIEDIRTGKRSLLSVKEEKKGWLKFGHYYFNPDVLQRGREILETAPETGARLVVIDEVGPLEMGNLGWAPSIEKLCMESQVPQLWVVRKTMVKTISRKWNVGDIHIFNIKEDNIEDLMKVLTELF